MEKAGIVKSLLEDIKSSEGEGFVCDENALFDAIENEDGKQSNLAIKLLSVFGGFLGSLAFFGFLAIAGIFDNDFGPLGIGIVSIVAALVLNKLSSSLILDTFGVCFYIVGIVCLAFGLVYLEIDENTVAFLIALVALATLFIVQNYIQSFIAMITMATCFLTLIIHNDAYLLMHLYLGFYTLTLVFWSLNEAKLITQDNKLAQLYDPVRIGLVFSLLFGLIAVGKRDLIPISHSHLWISSLFTMASILYLVPYIIKVVKMQDRKHQTMVYVLSVLTLLPSLFCPSISGAILILLLGFYINHKTTLVIGIVSLIYFVSQYYYDLHFTLLTKSIILISSGLVFIAFYLFTLKMLKKDEKS
ncbi:DUF4401 domain-containing protein [Flagellimonas sp.]|uniref:DUF4401 domain-containing protein n=1 Tax=Flagellimonas sp. TaxID=2058762 RepID=UPI003B5ACF83